MNSVESTEFHKIKKIVWNVWQIENSQCKQHTGQKRKHNGNLKIGTLNDNKNRTH